jgi:hypothetical protein
MCNLFMFTSYPVTYWLRRNKRYSILFFFVLVHREPADEQPDPPEGRAGAGAPGNLGGGQASAARECHQRSQGNYKPLHSQQRCGSMPLTYGSGSVFTSLTFKTPTKN